MHKQGYKETNNLTIYNSDKETNHTNNITI